MNEVLYDELHSPILVHMCFAAFHDQAQKFENSDAEMKVAELNNRGFPALERSGVTRTRAYAVRSTG